jgi:hypothetical protein
VRAAYFPVEETPLRMAASLARFGADFGQGALDTQYFQRDDRAAEFAALKRVAPATRRFEVGDDAHATAARAEALRWMKGTLAAEHGLALPDAAGFSAVAEAVQEDFAVLTAGPDDVGRTLVVDVRFPSGWRPERLREATFDAIHGPVPAFPGSVEAARAMVRAMVDRGPYVRFVWALTPTPHLDQHPDVQPRRWEDARGVWFRVERQVTVPLPATRSSVFLIRVHVTPAAALSEGQRARLLHAVRVMPARIRRYKSLPTVEVLEALLGEPPPP